MSLPSCGGALGGAAGSAAEIERRRKRRLRGAVAGHRGHLHERAVRPRLRVVHDVLVRVDRRPPHVVLREDRRPFVARAAGEDLVEDRDQRLGVAAAIAARLEALVGEQFLCTERLHDRLPVALGFRADEPQPFAVRGAIRVHERVLRTGARRRRHHLAERQERRQFHALAEHARAQERRRDELTTSGALAVHERAEDAGDECDGSHVVAHAAGKRRRHAARRCRAVAHAAARGERRHVETWRVLVGSGQGRSR